MCDESRPYCFISYSSLDKVPVHAFARKLIERGVNVWIDWELEKHIGKKWDEIVERTIFNENCACVLWFVSAHSCQSGNVAKELVYVGDEAVVNNHGGKAVDIYPLELQTVQPHNNLMEFCHQLKKQATQDGLAAIEKIVGVMQDNRATRLSARQVFQPQGLENLLSSLKNDGHADVVENPMFRFHENYLKTFLQRYDNSQNEFLGTIDSALLPTVVKENGDGGEPMATAFLRLFSQNEKIALMMIGNGGTGKTTSLVYLMRMLAENGYAGIYVPLNEISQENPVLDYAYWQVIPETAKRPSYADDFFQNGRVVYLLDGLNEVAPQNESFVKAQIEMLLSKRAGVVITTRQLNRTQPKYKSIYAQCDCYNVVPLSEKTINDYLKTYELSAVSGKTAEILSSPLMLKLYVKQETFAVQDYAKIRALWKTQTGEASLIWNYLLWECATNWKKRGEESADVLFALFRLAPYLAWSMVAENRMALREMDRALWLSKLRGMYLNAFQQKAETDNQGESEFFLEISLPDDYDSPVYENKTLFNLLLEMGILLQQGNGTFVFFHQSFRDCLAALHCLNMIRMTPKGDVEALSKHILPDEVLRFADGLDTWRALDTFWRNLDRAFSLPSDSSTRMNLILCFNLRYGSLAPLNFAGKDLRGVSLNSFLLTDGGRSARFTGAQISPYTFAPPVTHRDYITTLAVSEDFKYIFSGDNDGRLIVYDTELGKSVDSRLFSESGRIAIREVVWDKGRLYVCCADARTYALDFAAGGLSEGRVLCPAAAGDAVSDVCLLNGKIYLALRHKLVCVDTTGESEPYTVCEFGERTLNCLACNAEDDGYLFCGLSDGAIVQYDLQGDYVVDEWLAHTDEVICMAWQKEFLFSASADRKVLKWNVFDESLVEWRWDTNAGKKAGKIALSQDGKYLFSASTDGNLLRVDAQTAKIEHAYKFSATAGVIHALCVSTDGKFLVTDGLNNAPVIRDTFDKDNPYRDFYNNVSGAVVAMNVSPNGKFAIVQSQLGRAIEYTVWDLENAVPCHTPIVLPSLWGSAKTISDDGNIIVIGQGERVAFLNLRNEPQQRSIRPLERYKGWMYSVALDDEEGKIWIGANDGKIYRLSADDASLLDCSDVLNATVNCFCKSKEGFVYAGDWGGTLYKFDLNVTAVATLRWNDYADWINEVYASFDGKWVYAALDNGCVLKADSDLQNVVASWRYSGKRRWDKPSISAITAVGGCLVAVASDFTVFVLNADTLQPEKRVDLKESMGACSVAQIENTSKILIGKENGDVVMYDVFAEETIRCYRKIKNVCLVGCDFRRADFADDEKLKEALKNSGAIV